MTDWTQLTDVYGSAEQVPALLTQAAGSDEDPAWDDLWGRLCHQGTVSSASYAALPLLTAMCRARQPAGYIPALYLAAGIPASQDGPEPADAIRARHEVELTELRDLPVRDHDLSALRTTFDVTSALA